MLIGELSGEKLKMKADTKADICLLLGLCAGITMVIVTDSEL